MIQAQDLDGINNVQELVDGIKNSNCQLCPRAQFRLQSRDSEHVQQITVARGNPEAQVWIVGKSPGIRDGAQGVPFSFGSGDSLAKMMHYIGLDWEKDCFITNPVFCAAQDDANPTMPEIRACSEYFDRLVKVGKPKVLIALGSTALAGIAKTKTKLEDACGKNKAFDSRFEIDGQNIPMFVLYHPAYFFKPGADVTTIKRKCKVTLDAIRDYLSEDPGNISTTGEIAERMGASIGKVNKLDEDTLRKLRWTAQIQEMTEWAKK